MIRVWGSVAEWSKALVLGTSHFDGVGSNPTTAIFYNLFSWSLDGVGLKNPTTSALFYNHFCS